MEGEVFDLSDHYEDIVRFCKHYGGNVVITDLRDTYKMFPTPTYKHNVFYSGLCNGRTIFIHDDNNIMTTHAIAWDALHLTGHMLQWHTPEEIANRIGIRFFAKKAKDCAIGNFFYASAAELQNIMEYELEANRFAISIIKEITFGDIRCRALKAIVETAAADLHFILNFYNDFDENRVNKFEVPPIAEIRKSIVPLELPSSSLVRFQELPILTVPVLTAQQCM